MPNSFSPLSSMSLSPISLATRGAPASHRERGRAEAQRGRAKNVVILTATITPNAGVPNLMRSDPKQRLKDYEHALRFYVGLLGSGIDRIVFAENSASDLSTLRAIATGSPYGDRISFLSLYALDYPPEFDRGYGELMLLDRVMDELNATDVDDVVYWKVTGRYIVKNLVEIVSRASPNLDLFIHCRNRPRKLVDMYLMGWTRRGYQIYLRGKCDAVATSVEHIRAGIHPEELLRSALSSALTTARDPRLPAASLRMRPTPELQGVRAGDNKEYSVHNLWKYRVRRQVGRFLPFIWI